MKISLRKANALQHSINETIKGVSVRHTISINEFEIVGSCIAVGISNAVVAIAQMSALNDILFEIRESVGMVNASVGVTTKLAKVARVARDIELYTPLALLVPAIDSVVLDGKLDKIRNTVGGARNYAFSDEVSTVVFNTTDIDGFKSKLAQMKKEKVTLLDQLLELNVQHTITLSDNAITVLTANNLL